MKRNGVHLLTCHRWGSRVFCPAPWGMRPPTLYPSHVYRHFKKRLSAGSQEELPRLTPSWLSFPASLFKQPLREGRGASVIPQVPVSLWAQAWLLFVHGSTSQLCGWSWDLNPTPHRVRIPSPYHSSGALTITPHWWTILSLNKQYLTGH